jgi:hypothetical protein
MPYLNTTHNISRYLAIFAALLLAPFSVFAEETPASIGVPQPLMSSAVLAATQSCGNSVNADIVIMIDKTGSISSEDLKNEQNAAKTLLNFFNSALTKPRIAVGTFNETNNKPSKKNPSEPDYARIVDGGSLTNVYGADGNNSTGLYAAVNNISNPSGSTDIGAAIKAAQGELAANGSSIYRFIILISDGVTNLPETPVLNKCSGGTPGESANHEADAAELAGSKIFAVHFGNDGSCPAGTGVNFLKDNIATTLAFFYEGNTDLPAIFSQLSQSIVCEDNNDCTVGACNSNSNQCEYGLVGNDSDSDGTPDQCDLCPNDVNKTSPGGCGCGAIDTPGDDDGDGVLNCVDNCQGGVVDICGVCKGDNKSCKGCDGVEGSGKIVDHCGVCGGDGKSCLLCDEVDITSSIQEISGSTAAHKKVFDKLIKNLFKRSNATNIKKFVKKTKNSFKKIYDETLTLELSVPHVNSVCANTTLCVKSDYTGTLDKYKVDIKKLNKLTKKVFTKLKLYGATPKSLKKFKKLSLDAFTKALAGLAAIPTSTQVCS